MFFRGPAKILVLSRPYRPSLTRLQSVGFRGSYTSYPSSSVSLSTSSLFVAAANPALASTSPFLGPSFSFGAAAAPPPTGTNADLNPVF